MSTCADVGCIGFRDSERRSQSKEGNGHQPRLNLPDIGILIAPICFRRRTPSPFRDFAEFWAHFLAALIFAQRALCAVAIFLRPAIVHILTIPLPAYVGFTEGSEANW